MRGAAPDMARSRSPLALHSAWMICAPTRRNFRRQRIEAGSKGKSKARSKTGAGIKTVLEGDRRTATFVIASIEPAGDDAGNPIGVLVTLEETTALHKAAEQVAKLATALERAQASDARLAKGEGGAMEGIPVAIKDLFCTQGVQTTASLTVSRLIDDYDKLPEFLRALGFSSCTFSYPLTSLASSYLSFSDSKLVSYSPEELIGVFERIKAMKKRSGYAVVNPIESLTEMQRHLRKEPERFSCLGGHKYFYLDWNLDLYRCHAWDKPMCNIYDFDESKLIRDGCTKCMIDCYRDPSVLQFVAISASDAWSNVKKGRLGAAAGNVFDRRNLISLRAVWEDRNWIGKV